VNFDPGLQILNDCSNISIFFHVPYIERRKKFLISFQKKSRKKSMNVIDDIYTCCVYQGFRRSHGIKNSGHF